MRDETDDDDLDGDEDDVPDGAAVFPEIPAELGVNPLLLGAVHALVFLAGSDEKVVQPAAADEQVERMAEYLRRLEGADLRRVKEDMACLETYAKQAKWPRGLIVSLKSFLSDLGIETGEESE